MPRSQLPSLDHHNSSTRTPGRFVTGLKTPGRATPRQESAGGLDWASNKLAQENPGEGHGTTESVRAVPHQGRVSRCFTLFNEHAWYATKHTRVQGNKTKLAVFTPLVHQASMKSHVFPTVERVKGQRAGGYEDDA